MKKIYILFLSLFAVGSLYAAVNKATLANFTNEYEENPIAFETKYQGKEISFSAYVFSISKANPNGQFPGQFIIGLGDSKTDSYGIMFSPFYVVMSDKTQVSSLKTKELYEWTCTFKGIDKEGDPFFASCKLK